jgi:ubiquinone/menaquinone biosynthesis C-methylase UbiE
MTESRSRGGGHAAAIREEFARQAASFEDPKYSFGNPRLLSWILRHIPYGSDDTALDVAAGTGHLARALAPHVRHVIALDLTEQMLQAGHAATSPAVRNIIFQLGDASALPFLDDSFDLIVCRFALHHFEAVQPPLAEMARVCRPGGHVAIVDLISPEPQLAARYNELERMRDPTHVQALTREELAAALDVAGLSAETLVEHDQPLELDRWLLQTQTPAEVAGRIRAALETELAGGEPTGMRPAQADDGLSFTQRWAIAVCTDRGS